MSESCSFSPLHRAQLVESWLFPIAPLSLQQQLQQIHRGPCFFFLTWAPSFCIYGLCHLKVTACSWVSFDGCMHVEVSPCRQRSRTRERANGTDKHLRWLRIPLHSAACCCHRSGSAFNMITGTHVQRAVTHLQSHTHKNTPACLCWIIWKTQREAATCAFMAVWPTFTLGTNTAPR